MQDLVSMVVRVRLNLYCLFCFISLQCMCNNSFSQIFPTISSNLRDPISSFVISILLFRLLSHHYLARNNGSCIPAKLQ